MTIESGQIWFDPHFEIHRVVLRADDSAVQWRRIGAYSDVYDCKLKSFKRWASEHHARLVDPSTVTVDPLIMDAQPEGDER